MQLSGILKKDFSPKAALWILRFPLLLRQTRFAPLKYANWKSLVLHAELWAGILQNIVLDIDILFIYHCVVVCIQHIYLGCLLKLFWGKFLFFWDWCWRLLGVRTMSWWKDVKKASKLLTDAVFNIYPVCRESK